MYYPTMRNNISGVEVLVAESSKITLFWNATQLVES
jgi:hypothetical protein